MQVPEATDSECIECTLVPAKRTHWSCRLFRAQRASCTHTGALSQSCSWEKMLDFWLEFVILKKTNKKKTVAARLWDDMEMGQPLNEFIYGFHEEQASWKVTTAKWEPAAKISSFLQKYKRRIIFLFYSTRFVHSWTWLFGVLVSHVKISFALKNKQIITIQYFLPITKTTPFKRVGLCLALESLVKENY